MNEEQTFTLPKSQKEVVIKGYVSGAIDAEVQTIIQEGFSMESDIDLSKGETAAVRPGKGKIKFSPSSTSRANRRALELMLISLDGNTENVYKRFMELPKEDVDFVTNKIDELTTNSQVSPAQKKS